MNQSIKLMHGEVKNNLPQIVWLITGLSGSPEIQSGSKTDIDNSLSTNLQA